MIFMRIFLLSSLLLTSCAVYVQCADSSVFKLDCLYKTECIGRQCINQTHDRALCRDVLFECVLKAPEGCEDYNANLSRLSLASIPIAFNCAVIADTMYRRIPQGFKILARMVVYTAAYTATCLYAYENYTNGGDVATVITGCFVIGGNAAITHHLAL